MKALPVRGSTRVLATIDVVLNEPAPRGVTMSTTPASVYRDDNGIERFREDSRPCRWDERNRRQTALFRHSPSHCAATRR